MSPRPEPDPKASTEAHEYLRQSALALARLCRKHFGITGKSDELRIETDLRPSAVASFMTEYMARVRPADLSAEKALPEPNSSILRMFLWRRPIADPVLNDVVRLSLYSDQIVIVDPFSALVPTSRHPTPPTMNPVNRPDLWIQEFANHALMICALEQWMEKDIVILIPEPQAFVPSHPPFAEMAVAAAGRGILSLKDLAREGLHDYLESLADTASNDSELEPLARWEFPNASDGAIKEIVQSLRAYRRANPTRYSIERPRDAESISGQGSGQNVFEAGWIADTIGGYVVPRNEIDRAAFRKVSRGSVTQDSEDALAAAFAAAELPMLNNVSLAEALDLRKTGRLRAFRAFLHETWATTSDPGNDPKTAERERDLVDRLKVQHQQVTEEWHDIYKDLAVKGTAAVFGGEGLARVVESSLTPLVVGGLAWLYRTWSGPVRILRRKPAALLLQLEGASSPNPIRRAVAALERRI